MTGFLAAMAAIEPPVRLIAEPVTQGVRITVVGAADRAVDVSFALEVDGDGNRTVHHGSARLVSGAGPVVLSKVTLGVAPDRPWRAHLRVQPDRQQEYEQSRSSR